MKKTLVVILVVIMCLMATLPLVGCGNLDNPGQGGSNQHEHNYTSKVVAATCINREYILYSCSCGDSYSEYTGSDYAKHTGVGNCTVCGLNSYEVLKDNIKRNGQVDSEGKYTIIVSLIKSSSLKLVYFSDGSIGIFYYKQESSGKYAMALSFDKNLNYQEYSWMFSTEIYGLKETLSIGVFNASTFTDDTKYLIETATDAPSAVQSILRELSASVMRTLIYALDLYFVSADVQLDRTNFGFFQLNGVD